MTASADERKRAAGFAAVDRFVRNDTCIGLGTGSTAYWAIERVGRRVAAGERIRAVATSSETERLCRERDIPLVSLMDEAIDVAIDGADEVGPGRALIKGGGGALFREKAVALAARRFVAIVTEEKLVARLGAFPLPVEVVPFSAGYVARAIEHIGCPHVRRRGADTPFITDNGNWILDCAFGAIEDAAGLEEGLRGVHGVVDSGLFVGLATEVLVGGADGVRAI